MKIVQKIIWAFLIAALPFAVVDAQKSTKKKRRVLRVLKNNC